MIGAGIAGAALARALHAEGIACTVIEAERSGAGASGNPAALVTPRLDAGFGPAAELHAQAFARAVDLYETTASATILARGALQLGTGERDAARFAKLAAWSGFAPGALTLADRLAPALDEPAVGEGSPAALRFRDALVVAPAEVLEAWLAGAERIDACVERLERSADGLWRLLGAGDRLLIEADAVVLAAGADADRLAPDLGLGPIRGQAEFTSAPVFSGEAAAWGPYAVPLRGGGVLFGASHVRGDPDRALRPEESAANLRALAQRRPALAARVAALPPGALQARAATRASTPDHLPLAGELERGLFVLGGLGGRGFTLAPLLAEHLAARIAGTPSPLPQDLARRLDPLRFGRTRGRSDD